MGRRRALMTDRERELIAGKTDGDEDLRYQDVSILEEHHQGLMEELEGVVCEEK